MAVELAARIVKADRNAIEAAARVLAAGGLVAFPTETVYGLGADATNGAAIARLYAAKGRPAFNPLIAHIANDRAGRALAHFNVDAERLARAFWPGPLTLVLPKSPACPVAALATAGLDTIALRVPAHPVASELLAAFGRPIVAPSANRSGHVSPTTAEHVLIDLGDAVDLIVDGGATPVGIESTIVACLDGPPALLRPGGVPRDALETTLGRALSEPREVANASPLSPGQLAYHYAPKTPLRLNAETVRAGEACLAFGRMSPTNTAKAAMTLNLSPAGDLVEAAANLFAHLRALDEKGAVAIAVMPVPQQGLGEAINDRLRRAAAR
jgi:L-threonylcarbamoyladenylate synthase